MNTYLIPYACTESHCDIFKVVARSYAECKQKIMNRFIRQYEDDDKIADIDDYNDFCDYLWDTYDIMIGEVHELDEYVESSL